MNDKEAFEGMLAALKRIANEVHAPGRFAASMPHDMREQARAAIAKAEAAPTLEPGWKDDPSADERWNAGLDYGQTHLCKMLGIDPASVSWDAATETLDGDVQSVIGNILTARFGDDWRSGRILSALASPAAPQQIGAGK